MLANGTLLQNRYLIKRPLAQGGMGTVYEAEAIHLGHAQVAVKETFFTQDWLREQFKREASMLARLRHNALPKVSDHFVEETGQFLVMEFIPGHDLDGLLSERLKSENKPFEWRLVMQWADRLLDALEYIHGQQPPIIHRDIKPQNLKLTPGGDLFLIDFGLAKDATTPTKPGGRSVHAYTLNYAPPEQLKGTGTDARSDLYSLGATLHHLLSGEMPENAKVREEVIRYGVPDPLRPIHEINESVPPALTEAIVRSMQLERSRRYRNAAEMREALREARQTIEHTDYQTERPSKRLRATQHPPEEDLRNTQEIAERAPKEKSGDDPNQELPQPDTLIVPPPAISRAESESLRSEQEFDRKRKKEIERRRQPNQLTRGQAKRTSPDFKLSNLPPVAGAPFVQSNAVDPSAVVTNVELLRKKARFRMLLIAGAAALILISLANLLWFNREKFMAVQTPPAPLPTPSIEIPAIEKLRYWFEVEGQAVPVTTHELPMANGIKFHFKPREDGYLYLLALNNKNQLTAFLYSRPVKADADLAFPSDAEGWFRVRKDTREATVTVLLAREPIENFDAAVRTANQELMPNVMVLDILKRLLDTETHSEIEDLNQRGVAAVAVKAKENNKPLIFDIAFKFVSK